MKYFLNFLAILAIAVAGLHLWRRADARATAAEEARLADLPARARVFDPALVADLPEPVRRYFAFAIAPGTPLYRRVTLQMEGELGLGTKEAPGYFPFEASQIIAAPEGFVWALDGRMKGLSVTGSDTGGWTRFWVAGLAPVARAGGTEDHRLSAFGRYMSEAVLWLPTALVPSDWVSWSSPGPDLAQADISYDGMELSLLLRIGADGRPVDVQFQRWSDANPEKTYQFQSFGGKAEAWMEVQGVQIGARVEAGNFYDSDAYFPFFKARVTDAVLE